MAKWKIIHSHVRLFLILSFSGAKSQSLLVVANFLIHFFFSFAFVCKEHVFQSVFLLPFSFLSTFHDFFVLFSSWTLFMPHYISLSFFIIGSFANLPIFFFSFSISFSNFEWVKSIKKANSNHLDGIAKAKEKKKSFSHRII